MQPRITVITLGVENLEASLRFYRDGLGFASSSSSTGLLRSFTCNPGCVWPFGRAAASPMTLG